MGRHDEQIKKIVNLLNINRTDWIKDYEKISPILLNDEDSQISSEILDFLFHRISELIKLKNISTSSEILSEAIARFKVELFNYLQERKKHTYLCEIEFRDGYSLFKVFKALRESNDKIVFRILYNEIHAYTTNEAKTYLFDIILKSDNSQFFLNKQLDLLVNLDSLLKCLECDKSEKITTNFGFNEEKIEIIQSSPILKSKISRNINDVKINYENKIILDELIELKYKGCCSLDKDKFFHITSQAGRFSEGIGIQLTNSFIHFYDNNEEGNTNIRWENKDIHKIQFNSQDIKERIKVYISIDNLKKVSSFLFEDNSIITLHLDEEIPLKLSIDFKTLEKTVGWFFIAQRDVNAYD